MPPVPSPITYYHITLLCLFMCVVLFFLATLCGLWILVPQPGIEPGPLAVKAPSPNHWTTREFRVWHFSQSATLLFLSFSRHLH